MINQWLAVLLAFAILFQASSERIAFAAESARELEAQAESQFERGLWPDAEATYLELLAVLEADRVPNSSALQTTRLRLRCWYQLELLARQAGRPDDALKYALWTRESLVAPADTESRRQNALHVAEYHLALDNDAEARAILRELLAGRFGELKTLPRLRTEYLLGVVEHRANHREAANTAWNNSLLAIQRLLNQHRQAAFLSMTDRVDLQQRQIAILEAVRRNNDANAAREKLLAEFVDKPNGDAPAFQMLLGLARHARLRGDVEQAEKHLRSALERSGKVAARQRASAFRLLATILENHDVPLARAAWLQMARAIEPLDTATSPRKLSIADLRLLIEGYSKAESLPEAIRAAERLQMQEDSRFGPTHRFTIAASVTLADLSSRHGELTRAEALLRHALSVYRTALAPNSDKESDQRIAPSSSPREWLRTLTLLASIRRAVGDLSDAEKLLREAIDIAERQLPKDDPDRNLARLQLAALLPSAGRFRDAAQLNQQLLEEAQQRGEPANRLQADVLFNLAVIEHTQGRNDAASVHAEQAARIAESALGRESGNLAAINNVLAAIRRDQGFPDQAAENAQLAWRLCQQHGRKQSAEAATAQQLLGSLAARRGELPVAMRHWQLAAEIFRARGQTSREAHVLSQLGGLAMRTNDRELSEAALDQAERLLRSQSTSPLDRYVVLANQALRKYRGGNRDEAIKLLQEAVDIAETARTETAGNAESGRARFFAQFAPAFERLAEWRLEAGDLKAAFLTAEQSRSRTFLDQLQLAGVDLKATLPTELQQRLLPQERALSQRQQDLRRQIAAASVANKGRAAKGVDASLSDAELRAALVTEQHDPQAEQDAVAVWQRELAEAERDYSKAWQAIRDASPVYAQLLVGRDSLSDLPKVQRDALPPDTLLLFFQLGQRSSNVWIIGDPSQPVEVIPLELSQTLPALQFREGPKSTTRGLVGRLSVDKGLFSRGLQPIPPGPVTRDIASRLVTWYLAATVPTVPHVTRGLAGTVATVKGEPIAPSALTIVADTLLPLKVREAISRRKPHSVIVVPDGALHQLPFESLLLTSGPRLKYVLDEWPPIAYAPSATVLTRLTERSRAPAANERNLLLVGHASEGRTDKSTGTEVGTNSTDVGRPTVAVALPGVSDECRRIQEFWPKPITSLLNANATQTKVLSQLSTHRLVHLATHGFVDEQTDNLFGGLLLASTDQSDNGYLTYLDILRSDLSGCELAVLSACQTNVGPERPMEASTSLAQAFLTAGTQQVVASLWQVSDEGTAELMSAFYQRLAEDIAANRPLQVASALHSAKRKLRQQDAWSSPAHWASFVFVGPAK